MKKILKKSLLLALVFFTFLVLNKNVNATTTSGEYTYIEDAKGNVIITKYAGNSKNVTVPSVIDEKKISTIRTLAFQDNSTITALTLSEGIEIIEAYAIENCPNLEKVTFPSTMLSISDLFYKKSPKVKYNIPETLTRVDSGEYLYLDHVTIEGRYEYDTALEIIAATNEHRKANGFDEIQMDSELMEAAMHRAAETAIFEDHTRPNGLIPQSILESKAYKENIYAATMLPSASAILTGWKNSPGHNSTMLEKGIKSIGVGVFRINGWTYAVQVFSNKSATDQTTKEGKIEKSTTIAISPLMDIVSMKITGLQDSNVLKIGETLEPEKINIYNTKFYNGIVTIKNSDVNWQSSDNNVFTVDKNGKITAKAPGTATLTAKLGNYTKTYEINVTADGVSMSVDKRELQLNGEGSTIKLNATLSTGIPIKATWTSSNTDIATVDENGIVTAKKGGFVNITAKSAFGQEEIYIYVCALRTLSDGSKTYPGDLNQDGVINSIDATITIEWYNKKLTADEVAVADINADGVVNSNDVALLLDMYNRGNQFKPGEYKKITSISINKTNAILEKGATLKLTTTITPADTTDSNKVLWKSSNENVAKVDNNGLVTAIGGGTATITAISNNGSGISAKCVITVNGPALEIPITSITIDKTSLVINENDSYTLKTTINPTNTTNDKTITWKSSNPAVAAVDKNGKIIAIKEGYTTVTATSSNGKQATCKVTVESSLVKLNGVQYNNNTKRWEYYVNGKVDYTYNGVATNDKGTWYVDNGIVIFTHDEVIRYNNRWIAFTNSRMNMKYTGLLKNSNGTWYVVNGIVDCKYNGTYTNTQGKIYLIKNSRVNTAYTGLEQVNSKWYYFKNGVTDYTYNGVATNDKGTWYVDNGIVTFTHDEVVRYNNRWIAFTNSRMNTKYTGLLKNSNGTWYVVNGIVDCKYNGTYTNTQGKIYLIKNSRVNTIYTGLEQVNGKWYYFKNGVTDYTYNGVATNDKGTWYVDNGIVTFTHDEVVRYNNRWIAFTNSRMNMKYTGLLKNSNGTWYVVNGIVDCKYNGTYKDSNGKVYTIKNSKVVK